MKILIITATDFELDKNQFSNHEMLISGIGILETALKLTKKLTSNNYDLVINTGIAGSFNKDIKISATVDPVLIGGMIVKVGSRMIDTTIKSKLNSLQNVMKEVG